MEGYWPLSWVANEICATLQLETFFSEHTARANKRKCAATIYKIFSIDNSSSVFGTRVDHLHQRFTRAHSHDERSEHLYILC